MEWGAVLGVKSEDNSDSIADREKERRNRRIPNWGTCKGGRRFLPEFLLLKEYKNRKLWLP